MENITSVILDGDMIRVEFAYKHLEGIESQMYKNSMWREMNNKNNKVLEEVRKSELVRN